MSCCEVEGQQLRPVVFAYLAIMWLSEGWLVAICCASEGVVGLSPV